MQGPLNPNDEKLITEIRKRYLVPPSTGPYLLRHNITETVVDDYRLFLGHAIVDSVLVDLFSKKKNGFFVEAGALDGEFLTNTLRLEQDQNWTGLLVEPDPDSFQVLKTKNRKSWLSEACLSVHPYPEKLLLSKRREEQSKPNWLLRASANLVQVSK